MIDSAIAEANQNKQLNQFAKGQRQDALLKNSEKTNHNIINTNNQADNEVTANPEIWQRGKDRAAFILS